MLGYGFFTVPIICNHPSAYSQCLCCSIQSQLVPMHPVPDAFMGNPAALLDCLSSQVVSCKINIIFPHNIGPESANMGKRENRWFFKRG